VNIKPFDEVLLGVFTKTERALLSKSPEFLAAFMGFDGTPEQFTRLTRMGADILVQDEPPAHEPVSAITSSRVQT
jgi:hypothetical protein